jgi:nitrate reductase (NAD(P)H)
MDERYAIYDLSPNSALAFPAHEEQVSLSTSSSPTYNVRGYAYSGGGRRITRVEITLDKGRSWNLANILYPEDHYRSASSSDESLFGGRIDTSWRETAFCWCFWSLDIPLTQLADCDDIMVRSMDEAMCVQPRDMYWSVLGMMNNPWFRVCVHREGEMLRFEHPTQPALIPGGWMERVKKDGGDLENGFWGEKLAGDDASKKKEVEKPKEVNMKKEGVDKMITIDELRKHDREDEGSWFVVNGEVYDGTAFFDAHPGGAQSIISAAGTDASDEFMAIRKLSLHAPLPFLLFNKG